MICRHCGATLIRDPETGRLVAPDAGWSYGCERTERDTNEPAYGRHEPETD